MRGLYRLLLCLHILGSCICRQHRFLKNKVHPHSLLSVPELIRLRGYPVETHHAVTSDGYILTIYRIPGPRNTNTQDNRRSRSIGVTNQQNSPGKTSQHTFNNIKIINNDFRFGNTSFSKEEHGPESTTPARVKHSLKQKSGGVVSGKKKVVLLQHCLHCSSYDFILNKPDKALAFILADRGYDVWIGNFRGTKQSRSHLHLDPKRLPFWQFNIDHLSAYDLPTTIDFVLNKTDSEKIHYVGHSLGSMTFFSMINLFPKYNDKIHVMAALAPGTSNAYSRGEARKHWLFARVAFEMFEGLGMFIVGEKNKIYDFTHNCFKGNILFSFCKNYIPNLCGKNPGYINDNYLSVVLTHSITSTSVRLVAHVGQMVHAKKFQQFDYGEKENKKKYGQTRPPEYDLTLIKMPVGVFWTQNDYLTSPKDISILMKKLPNLTLDYKVPLEDFNHMDFLLADNAAELVYKELVNFLDKY